MTNPTTENQTPVTDKPGMLLQRARVSQNLSLEQVAEQLHLTVQTVKDLENDDYSRIAGPVFSRGYLRSYAKLLQINAEAVLQAHDQIMGKVEGHKPHMIQPIQTIAQEPRLSWRIMRFSILALVLLIGGLVAFWWYEQQSTNQQDAVTETRLLSEVEIQRNDGTTQIHRFEVASPTASDNTETIEEADLPEISVSTPDSAEPAIAADDNQEPVTADKQNSELANNEPVDEPESSTHEVAKTENETEQPSLKEGEGRFEAQFSDECWLSVTDARGKSLFAGTKYKDQTLSVVGQAPISVHLGRVAGVTATYNGEPIDFSRYSREQTAKLKLGQ